MSSLRQVPKAITSTSKLVTKLLTPSSYPTRLFSSPFCTKSVASKVKAIRVVYPRVCPFQIEGHGSPFCMEQREEALYIRADLPGATKEGLKVWVKDNSIHFEAQEKGNLDKDWLLYERPRTFKGYAPLFPRLKYKNDRIRALLTNGVLKIVVPTADQ